MLFFLKPIKKNCAIIYLNVAEVTSLIGSILLIWLTLLRYVILLCLNMNFNMTLIGDCVKI